MLLPDRYDDGGFSGGNMQRGGLQRLLGAVAAGKVDIILVYKIDRLTRSLADFAKIVEVLDKAGASFVSITQSFNTTTSMGRLTLNMLLSFAQFEREVTGERIRDKIAASKRKGMWMGGPVPLGYQVANRKLLVHEDEAQLVRHIMQRYLQVGSVVELADELNAQGYRTKVQKNASGPHRGGCMFRRGTLYHLLANRIYIGDLVHKGDHFSGEHAAIISQDLWNAVQATLKGRASGTSRRIKAQQPSLLAGLVFDGEGRAMTPSHATKASRRYRYYITRPDQLDESAAWRVSAHDLEQLVSERLSALLTDQPFICELASGSNADDVQQALSRADLAAASLRSGSAHSKAEHLAALLERIDLRQDEIAMTIDRAGLCELLCVPSQNAEPLVLSLTAVKLRPGHQLRLVIPGPTSITVDAANRNDKLVALVAETQQARALVLAAPDKTLASIATTHGRCRTRLGKLAALACLAPDIVTAVVEGRQPPELTAATLLAAELPACWKAQRAMLGLS